MRLEPPRPCAEEDVGLNAQQHSLDLSRRARQGRAARLRRATLGGWRELCAPSIVDSMKTYTAVVERDPETGWYVGYVPGFPGAHSQGATLDELNRNLKEVIALLLEDGEPSLEAEFVGIQTVVA